MMGRQTGGETQLFYAFNLDEYIPQHHLLRRIDRFLDLSKLRPHLADFYSHTGRPSVDPELMIRMPIVGYCFAIRSERRLCDEVHLNLGYRWFCRLGLEGEVPDHSTFSKNRHGRFRESDVLRFVFDEVVRRSHSSGDVDIHHLFDRLESSRFNRLLKHIDFKPGALDQVSQPVESPKRPCMYGSERFTQMLAKSLVEHTRSLVFRS
jgi:transposase